MADATASTTASRTASFPKKALAAGFAAFATLTGVAATNAGEAHAAGVHNVRSGPGLNHPVIGTIYNPDCGDVEGLPVFPNSDGPWNPTHASNGRAGWIYNSGWCI